MINVSMTGDSGVTLATAGKYCPDNVKVTPVSTIKNTADATAAADDILSGKTAYINGAKVTGSKADNVRKWTVTIASDLSADTVLVTDAWIGQHYTDSNLEISYCKNESLQTTSNIYIVHFEQGNTPLYIRASDSWNCYGNGISLQNGNTPTNMYANNNLRTRKYNDYGSIVLNSSGQLKLILGGGVWLKAGTYTFTATLK